MESGPDDFLQQVEIAPGQPRLTVVLAHMGITLTTEPSREFGFLGKLQASSH